MRMQQHIINRFVLKKVLLFHVVFDVKGPLDKVCNIFLFISYRLMYDNTFFINVVY